MKYELSLKIEGDEVIRGVRINFIGEDGYEVLPDVVNTKRKSTKKSSPKGESLVEEVNETEEKVVPKKKKNNAPKSSAVIENSTDEIPPEMNMDF